MGNVTTPDRDVVACLVLGCAGFFLAPWYLITDGFWSLAWLADGYPREPDYAPAIVHALAEQKIWLLPLIVFVLAPALLLSRPLRNCSHLYVAIGGGGLAYLGLQGFAIGISGWQWGFAETWFGPLEDRQFGMGYGGAMVTLAMLYLLARGFAMKGLAKGDVFVAASICLLVASVLLFILYPLTNMLLWAMRDQSGLLQVGVFAEKFLDKNIWGLGCLGDDIGCGAAWNSLFLAVMVALLTTLLGLAFALVAVRSGFRHRKVLRALTVLPIITPPFVVSLAIILLFGLSGTVTQMFADLFGLQPTRWIYGMPGVLLAQVLAFTPIAFLVLIGVVEGVSPSMEEAAQTLRAGNWQTFNNISLPLMRPGLANAFLLGFIESMADFGNPLVLGGNFDVLSTEIFFAIVGAQNDQGRAAVLAIILLTFTLGAFFTQRFWLGRKNYTTVSGKGDGGVHARLPGVLMGLMYVITALWTALTLTIYLMILYGGFVKSWGLDHSLTFKHYLTNFSVSWTEHGLHWAGSAWNSFWTTLQIATISAPLTAGLGLLAAWLLVRQSFAGKRAFEFITMLSFAIPGTVIGVSYVLAFNVPPLELTGTGVILVISFIFRNMPVGVRSGIASMSQIDKSLDEAALTLGANSWNTIRHVILPLLRPAILSALVYSFVRSMTAISAVIFLVSAEYDMATSYIIGRVENNDYGLAIAYSTTLILVMLAATGLLQVLTSNRLIRRSNTTGNLPQPAGEKA